MRSVEIMSEPELLTIGRGGYLANALFAPTSPLALGGSDAALAPRIRYPAADMVIALDPDIPIGARRVVFEASSVSAGLRWRLDGSALSDGDARGRADWTPSSGKHTLTLEDLDGVPLSTVSFEVRGGSFR